VSGQHTAASERDYTAIAMRRATLSITRPVRPADLD